MDIETLEKVIRMLEGDAKSYIKHLDNTNDPFETGHIKGYHDALIKHAYMLQDYIDNQVAHMETEQGM